MRLLTSIFIFYLCICTPTEAWDGPAEMLGLKWGAPGEAVRQAFPDGQSGQDTVLTSVYYSTVTIDNIRLKVAFQFVSERGLQGIMLWFPISRLAEVVALFERQYGRAPIRRNAEWQWESTSVRISLGNYPTLSPRSGGSVTRTGVGWVRTKILEEAIARGEHVRELKGRVPDLVRSRSTYEEQILKKIYWQLRYPVTTPGIYLVSLAFHLSAIGRATELQITVNPPNAEVAESVRAAVARAHPFPVLPSLVRGARAEPMTLTLTVSILP